MFEHLFNICSTFIIVGRLRVQRQPTKYLRRLDGNAPFLFVLAGIGETGFSSLGTGDDTGLGDQRIGQRRLAVIDVGNDGHVTDVPLPVHHGADFVNGKVNLG